MPIKRDKTVQGTHYVECWREHHECAIAEIERMREVVKFARALAESERWIPAEKCLPTERVGNGNRLVSALAALDANPIT